jgi:hypothetical protein
MLATMLQDFVCKLEAQVEQGAQELWRTLDLAKLEEELSKRKHHPPCHQSAAQSPGNVLDSGGCGWWNRQ